MEVLRKYHVEVFSPMYEEGKKAKKFIGISKSGGVFYYEFSDNGYSFGWENKEKMKDLMLDFIEAITDCTEDTPTFGKGCKFHRITDRKMELQRRISMMRSFAKELVTLIIKDKMTAAQIPGAYEMRAAYTIDGVTFRLASTRGYSFQRFCSDDVIYNSLEDSEFTFSD